MGKINCLADKRGEIARVINYRKLGGTACYTGDSTLSTIQNNWKTKSKMNKSEIQLDIQRLPTRKGKGWGCKMVSTDSKLIYEINSLLWWWVGGYGAVTAVAVVLSSRTAVACCVPLQHKSLDCLLKLFSYSQNLALFISSPPNRSLKVLKTRPKIILTPFSINEVHRTIYKVDPSLFLRSTFPWL